VKKRTMAREVVGALAEEGLDFFTPADIAELMGIPEQRAREVAARLATANLARRVRRGLYAALPPTDWRDEAGFGVDWYVTATQLAGQLPHFLAYYTAMGINQMTQHPLRTVFVAVQGQRRDVEVGPARFRFITLAERKFFGHEPRKVDQWRVPVADLERTLIDCVDRPDLCGGLEEIFRAYQRRHEDIREEQVLKYLDRFGEPSAVKRVGFLLEAVGHGKPTLMWELARRATQHRRYVPLVKGLAVPGQRDKRWGLIIPEQLRQLVRAAPS